MKTSVRCVRIVLLLLIGLNWVTDRAYGSRKLNEDALPPVPPAPAASAAPAEMTITFFMHGTVGGANPTAIPVIAGGLRFSGTPFLPLPVPLSNTAVPFEFPPSFGLNLRSSFDLPTNGPSQFQFPQKPGLPFSNGQISFGVSSSFPLNGALQFYTFPGAAFAANKDYGGVVAIDGFLTEGPDHSSAVVGKGQGYYVPSGEDAAALFLSFTAKLEDPLEGSTIEFSGIDNTALHQREIAVVGGTGKFHNAQGHAIIETVSSSGFETVLKFTVTLTY